MIGSHFMVQNVKKGSQKLKIPIHLGVLTKPRKIVVILPWQINFKLDLLHPTIIDFNQCSATWARASSPCFKMRYFEEFRVDFGLLSRGKFFHLGTSPNCCKRLLKDQLLKTNDANKPINRFVEN